MSRTFEISTKPYDNYRLYNHKTVTINPGITVLTGCNGSGKSTLINHIKEQLEADSIPVYVYDNFHDGGERSLGAMLHRSSYKDKYLARSYDFCKAHFNDEGWCDTKDYITM